MVRKTQQKIRDVGRWNESLGLRGDLLLWVVVRIFFNPTMRSAFVTSNIIAHFSVTIFIFHFERYDFAVYGLLAPEIGRAFFPDASAQLQLVNSFGVYLAAFLMR